MKNHPEFHPNIEFRWKTEDKETKSMGRNKLKFHFVCKSFHSLHCELRVWYKYLNELQPTYYSKGTPCYTYEKHTLRIQLLSISDVSKNQMVPLG